MTNDSGRVTGWIDPREIVACYEGVMHGQAVVMLRSSEKVTIDNMTPQRLLDAVDAAYKAAGI